MEGLSASEVVEDVIQYRIKGGSTSEIDRGGWLAKHKAKRALSTTG